MHAGPQGLLWEALGSKMARCLSAKTAGRLWEGLRSCSEAVRARPRQLWQQQGVGTQKPRAIGAEAAAPQRGEGCGLDSPVEEALALRRPVRWSAPCPPTQPELPYLLS